jgi:RecB family exonuclease
MSITLLTGPANAGKARAVLDALRAHRARGAYPLLVVPTRADIARYARELESDAPAGPDAPAGWAGSGGSAGWDGPAGSGGPGGSHGSAPVVRVTRAVVRFEGLIAEVVQRAGSPQPPSLGATARARVLAALAARAGRSGRGTVRALGDFVAELRTARIPPGRLRSALQQWSAENPAESARSEELAALYEDYALTLDALGRTDGEQRATCALDELRRFPERWGARPVLLYGFDDFTPLQLDAIETLGVVVDAPLTVTLTFEAGRVAFAARARTFQELLPLAASHHTLAARAEYYAPAARTALHHLERRLFEPAPASVPAGAAIRLLEGGGERAELELVAHEIAALLAAGMPAEEIALAHRAPVAIADLVEEVFLAHGIPHRLTRRLRFPDTALGRALLGALAVACEQDAELEELLAWLRAPAVLCEPDLADELEACARRAGIASATDARALWERCGWPAAPFEPLDELRASARVRDRGQAQALIGCAARALEMLAAVAPPAPCGSRREARALEAGRAALAELGELVGGAAPGTVTLVPDAAALLATLRGLEFVIDVGNHAGPACARGVGEESPDRAPGEQQPETHRIGWVSEQVCGHGSGAVAVLDPLALRARRVRALFLCGMQEGVFPAPAPAEPLLGEDDRRRLVEVSGLRALTRGARSAGEALAAERHLLYAAVSRPQELLVLSWHTADDDGQPCSRSLFVDDVCDLFTCDLHATRRIRALGEVGEGGIGETRAPPRVGPLSDARVLGELGGERLWSASALEAWAGCPVRWFVERLLHARDLQPEPEPLARGALAHAVLRDVLDGLRRETGSARLRPAVLARARELLGDALLRHEREHPLSVAPERVPGIRRRLAADLERYLEHAARGDEQAGSGGQASTHGQAGGSHNGSNGNGDERVSGKLSLEPTHLELGFGFGEDDPAGLPSLDLGEGVRVRGRIDRVDLDPSGTSAVVYDYKGAHAPDAGRWARERNFQAALYMRAIESLPGVHAVGGFYQPLSGRDLRARGVLEQDAGLAVECVRGDAREGAEVRALVDEALALARTAAHEARAGELQARPATCGFGERGCLYPTICRCTT